MMCTASDIFVIESVLDGYIRNFSAKVSVGIGQKPVIRPETATDGTISTYRGGGGGGGQKMRRDEAQIHCAYAPGGLESAL